MNLQIDRLPDIHWEDLIRPRLDPGMDNVRNDLQLFMCCLAGHRDNESGPPSEHAAVVPDAALEPACTGAHRLFTRQAAARRQTVCGDFSRSSKASRIPMSCYSENRDGSELMTVLQPGESLAESRLHRRYLRMLQGPANQWPPRFPRYPAACTAEQQRQAAGHPQPAQHGHDHECHCAAF